MLTHSTPVELYNKIWVKREDLCAIPPAPPFSKYRGVEAHIAKRPEKVIGVLDTLHSKAGWAVAAACRELGKKCINYYPHYKYEESGLRPYQQKAAALGAELVALNAGMSAVLWNQARNRFHQSHPWEGLLPDARDTGYMMPNALKIDESAEETAREFQATKFPEPPNHVVISVSSGTIAAGVLRGLMYTGLRPLVHIHLGYSRPADSVRGYLRKMTAEDPYPQGLLHLVDEGYKYADQVTDIEAPFPCNSYYDLKAWKWVLEQKWKRDKPVLFWNIGA